VNPLAGNRKAWALNNRDHRRQLVVDGRVAFTGGVNISATYSSAPGGKHSRKAGEPRKPKEGWRDTHVEIEGPVVAEFQKLFMETWERQRGPALAQRDYFPKLETRGRQVVRVIGTTPERAQSQVFRTLMSAITHAESTIHLTIAYFAPDPQLLGALIAAARRGVDVRLLLPSYTDSSPIFHLGRSYYTKLLKGGVKIYERRGAIMHAKTACIDGVWSTVGSSNLDWRSFLHNDEINAVILGRGFAEQMEAMFARDIKESDPIELEKWRHRSWLLRLKERMARMGAYWL
jgi:cardiolipin synthase